MKTSSTGGLELYLLCKSGGADEWKRQISGRRSRHEGFLGWNRTSSGLKRKPGQISKSILHFCHDGRVSKKIKNKNFCLLHHQVGAVFTFTGASVGLEGEARRTGAVWPSSHRGALLLTDAVSWKQRWYSQDSWIKCTAALHTATFYSKTDNDSVALCG